MNKAKTNGKGNGAVVVVEAPVKTSPRFETSLVGDGEKNASDAGKGPTGAEVAAVASAVSDAVKQLPKPMPDASPMPERKVAVKTPQEAFQEDYHGIIEGGLNLCKVTGEPDPKTERDLFSSFAVFCRACGYAGKAKDKAERLARESRWKTYRWSFEKAYPVALEVEGEAVTVLKITNGKVRYDKFGVPIGERGAVHYEKSWDKDRTARHLERISALNKQRE